RRHAVLVDGQGVVAGDGRVAAVEGDHADDAVGEVLVTGAAVVLGVAVGVDRPVGGRHVVALAGGRGGDVNDALVGRAVGGRAEEAGVAEGEHAAEYYGGASDQHLTHGIISMVALNSGDPP